MLTHIAPSDFHLFRSLQHFLQFENLDDVKNAISKYFTQKPIDIYQSRIENTHTRWQKVVDNEGIIILIKNKNLLKIYSFECKKATFLSGPPIALSVLFFFSLRMHFFVLSSTV
ncbi:hypothetical protein X975_03591, partial [Stegodyphus mimosarum]